jgi:hypothetical protein
VPTSASVAVAFVTNPPAGIFRSVLMNISGVRINKTSGATSTDPGWVTIAVPSGVGSGNQQNPGDLQLDMLHTQTAATFFNIGGVPVGTYNTVQVLVDPVLPGTIVPACQAGVANTEGCINYQMQFDTSNTTQNDVIFTLSSPIVATANATSPLLIQLNLTINTLPVNTGDTYGVSVSASEVNIGSYLATVSGNVKITGTSSPSTAHVGPQMVSAELSGTNTVIETAIVKQKGVYTLELPAAPSGTSYDIFAAGGGFTFDSIQNLVVTPGQLVAGEDLSVKSITTTVFAGIISDGCTGVGIPGAQLQLLAPAVSDLPTPRPTPSATGLCLSNPAQCVVVANATTDMSGAYPLPGTTLIPAPFGVAPEGESDLAVRVSASGYTTLMSSVFLRAGKNQICSAGTSATECNFSLTTGYINGTVNLVTDPPSGTSVMVEVFAENSGTNQIVSALPTPLVFRNQQTSLPFTLNVPVSGVAAFDLFAVAVDPYLGATSPFPGHDISVLGGVPAPAAPCAFIPPSPLGAEPTPTPIALPPMDCVGHGSISGTVQNPDVNTSVEVEKQGVQILGTSQGLFSSDTPSNTEYTLCVPPDDYTLQRFETLPTSTAEPTDVPTAIATPIGPPQPITVPQPASTSSPCPSSCSNQDTSTSPCPGNCTATSASQL